MPYSTQSDLLLGEIPLPPYVNADAYISNAADEIDAVIGMTYVTPVSIQETPTTRPSKLLLKKANNFLASGRIIMAVDSGGQDSQLHTYGRYLVNQAEQIVAKIANGEFILVGAQRISDTGGTSGPVIVNGDTESMVDAFYGNFHRDVWPLNRGSVDFGSGS